MARTRIRSKDILDGGVKREDINTTISGRALITKLIAGHGIGLTSTGVDSGTGDVTVTLNQGTTNTIPQFGGSLGLVDSVIHQNGSNIGIGTTAAATKLNLSQPALMGMMGIRYNLTGSGAWNWELQGDGGRFKLLSNGTPAITVNWSREVGLNVTGDAGANLHIRDFTTTSTNANTPIVRLETRYHSGGSLRQITWHDGTNITGSIATNFDGTFTNLVFGHLYNGGYKTDNLMTLRGSGILHVPASMITPLVYGSEATGGNLALHSTSHATKGHVEIVDTLKYSKTGTAPTQTTDIALNKCYGTYESQILMGEPDGWIEIDVAGVIKVIPYYNPE